VEADDFNTEDYTRIHVFHDSDDREINVKFESEGTDHLYRFGMVDAGPAWPKYFKQGGETYRFGLDDAPDFVLTAVQDVYGTEVEER
jgi:hypothetical protein